MKKLADRLFDMDADAEPLDKTAEPDMAALLARLGVPHERIGWDYYDLSLELHGVPNDWRMPDDAQRTFSDEGFAKVYVNHQDGWETHYTWADPAAFAPHPGWRVNYPHKRQKNDGQIWVEKHVASWPADWFETGYVIIKQPGEVA